MHKQVIKEVEKQIAKHASGPDSAGRVSGSMPVGQIAELSLPLSIEPQEKVLRVSRASGYG